MDFIYSREDTFPSKMYNGFFDESKEAAPRIIILLEALSPSPPDIFRPATVPSNDDFPAPNASILLLVDSEISLAFSAAYNAETFATVEDLPLDGGGGGGVYVDSKTSLVTSPPVVSKRFGIAGGGNSDFAIVVFPLSTRIMYFSSDVDSDFF